MLNKENYPILEFDMNPVAKLEPKQKIKNFYNENEKLLPEYCVITFFKNVIEKKKEQGELIQTAYIASETLDIPIYVTQYHGKRICLVLGSLGANTLHERNHLDNGCDFS